MSICWLPSAAVPGTYEASASSAYLHYTAEDKAWILPVAVTGRW